MISATPDPAASGSTNDTSAPATPANAADTPTNRANGPQKPAPALMAANTGRKRASLSLSMPQSTANAAAPIATPIANASAHPAVASAP